MEEEINNQHNRIMHVERQVEGLSKRFAEFLQVQGSMQAQLQNQGTALSDLAAEMRGIRGDIRSSSNTDWKTIIAGLALFITIGTLAFMPVYEGIQRVGVQMEKLEDEAKIHQDVIGHRGMLRRLGVWRRR